MISVFILKIRIKSKKKISWNDSESVSLEFLNNNACNQVILLEHLGHFCEDSGFTDFADLGTPLMQIKT